MTDELASLKAVMAPVFRRHGATRASIVGSVARGEASPESEVDILVELPPEKSLLDLVDLRLELEETLGRRVDLAEYANVHPQLRERILSDQVAVY